MKKTPFLLSLFLLLVPVPAQAESACDKATTSYNTAHQACQKVLRSCLSKCPADAKGKSDLGCIAAQCPGMNETCRKVEPAAQAAWAACGK